MGFSPPSREGGLKPTLREATKTPESDELKRFLAFFGNQPQASSARAEFIERLTHAGRILEAELLMAAADLRAGQSSAKAPAWPLGEVEASKTDTNQNPTVNFGFQSEIRLDEPRGPFFADHTVSLDRFRHELDLRNGLGRIQESVRLLENNRVGTWSEPNSTWPDAAATS